MTLPTDREPHDCIAELYAICSSRPELTYEPLSNADFLLNTDDSTFWDDNSSNRVAYAIFTDSEVLGMILFHVTSQHKEQSSLR